MTAPATWSKDNPFVDQKTAPESANSFSADNPFVDHEPATPEAAAPLAAPTEGTDYAGIARGAGRAIKEVVQGTAQFFGEAASPLQQPNVTYDPKTGSVVATPVQPKTSGLELAKQAVVAPVQITAAGAKEATKSGATAEERAHGATQAALGALGILGGLKGIKEGIGKIKAEPATPVEEPVKGPIERIQDRQAKLDQQTPDIGTDFSKANTPEERQVVVDRLNQQAQATEATQNNARIQLLKAVQTWNTLSPEQRQSVVPGLASNDYAKTWKEVGKEARATIKQSLRLDQPTSGTILDTSQPDVSSGPSAQGEVPPASVPSASDQGIPQQLTASEEVRPLAAQARMIQEANATTASGQGIQKPYEPPVEKQLAHDDVKFMDVQSLRDQMAKADSRVADLQQEYDQRQVKSAPKSVELEFWEKYSEDLKNEMAARLKRPDVAGLPQAVDNVPDIGPVPIGDEHLGKRFTNPNQPDYQAVITKNTKPGEKPYRVSYFKKDAEGNVQTYLHNTFDTPQQAYDFVTGPGDERAGGSADKLRGYVEQAPPKEPSRHQVGNVQDQAKSLLGDLNKLGAEGAINDADAITRIEKEIANAKQKIVSDPDNASAHKAAIERWQDLLLGYGRVPDGIDINAKLKELADKEWSYTIGREPVTGGQTHEQIIDDLRNGKMPSSMAFDHETAIKALLSKGAKYPPPTEGDAGAGATRPPNAPDVGGPGSQAPTPPEAPPPGAEGTLEKTHEPPWSGFVDLRDGVVESKFTKSEAEAKDFHHNMLLSPDQLERMNSGEGEYFWIDRDGVARSMNGPLPRDIADKVLQQMREGTLEKSHEPPNSEDLFRDRSQDLKALSTDELVKLRQEYISKSMAEKSLPIADHYSDLVDQVQAELDNRPPTGQPAFQSRDQMAADKVINEKPQLKIDAIKSATPAELDNLIDDLDKLLEKGEITPEKHSKALFEIAEHKRAWKAQNVGPAMKLPDVPVTKFKMPDTVGKDLNKFSNDQLSNTKKAIGALLRSPDIAKLPEANVLRKELDRIFDYESQIRKASDEGKAGPSLAIKKIEVEGRPKYEQYFAKKIVLEPELKAPANWIKRLRQLYQGTAKQSHAANVVDRLYEGATGEKLQTHHMAGKLMEMQDGSMTQAEAFLKGAGPFIPDGQGGFTPTGAKSLADIVVNTADSQVERLGWLWAARRALELKALRNKSIGIDLGYAQELVVNSTRELHRAVDEARQYHSSLSLFGVVEGLISPEARAAFEQETSYGPIQRMYGPQEVVSKLAKAINTTGRDATKVMASDEFKHLKGGDLLIRNMVESSIDVTHRILRAAKINRIALELVNKAVDQPDLYRGMIDRFGHREHLQIVRDLTARAQAVKALYKEGGLDITDEHAHLFANLLSDNAMDVQGGKLLVWREGKIEAWKVDELLANSLKSLSPQELPLWVRTLGIPAKWGRIGIVLDPVFMAHQLIIDQFQGWFNTKYKFTPVLDSFKGWQSIMTNSEMFREAQRAGGVEKSSLRGRTSLDEILNGPAHTPGEIAFNQIQTMHPFKALNTMLSPIREATRMGEYLKARGQGATPIEAAWAARDLLGNYSLQGTFTSIRALNHLSLFLGPAIAVADKTFRTMRERPVQWFTRASSLAGIAALIYVANRNDEEIQQLRQTPGGQRWWFMRMPGGNIIKMRKPYLEGAIFADGMEAVLDQMNGSNPDAMKLWAQGIEQELALNMLPVMGVVPAELWANKDTNSGAPIVPEAQQGLDPQFQTGTYSGSAERIVGKTVGVSPAILSYVTRSVTGYLGESAVKAVSAAIDWTNTGELPPVEDLPLTQRVFAKYPSYGVKPVRDFYSMAEKVDRAAKTIDFASQHSPDDLETVLLAHEKELPLIELFNNSRQQISDLRKAIQSVDDLKDLGPQSKKLYTDEYLRAIIEVSNATVQVARSMQEDQGN